MLHTDDAIIKMSGMYKRRHAEGRLRRLADHFPVVVVSGARQVGKTTLVQHLFGAGAELVAFDPAIDVENARQDPDLFLSNHRTPLILDEIQYAPELVAAIKRRVDASPAPGQYILTGSQQWSVLRSVAESLAGRAVFLDLGGFTLAEAQGRGEAAGWLGAWLDDPGGFVQSPRARLRPERGPFEILWRGALPRATELDLDLVPDLLQAYLRTYVERDARLLADVSDWQLFGRFFRLLGALTAQELNYSQLGRELGLTPQTARRWTDILSATYQWFEVPPYSGNTVKRVTGRPKGYVADTGLACIGQAISAPRTLGAHPLLGALFETFVVGEVRKWAGLLSPQPRLHHWRTQAGAEVDLLVELDGVFHPIEVKAATQPSRRDTSGISAFRKTYPHLTVAPGLVICPCAALHRISDEDYALPWDTL